MVVRIRGYDRATCWTLLEGGLTKATYTPPFQHHRRIYRYTNTQIQTKSNYMPAIPDHSRKELLAL